MKRVLTAVLVAAGAILFAQETGTEIKPIKLAEYKADTNAKCGIANLDFYMNYFVGKAELVKDGKDTVLKITPVLTDYCKKNKKNPRSIARNTQAFDAKIGDTVIYEVEVKGEPGAKIGFIINNGGLANQWVVWQLKPKGKWLKGSAEYTIKATNDQVNDAKHKYYLAYDVLDKPVLIKKVKIYVKQAK